ncbi:dehydrogenase/reductase SDR family member 13 isoform X1 [Phasianus colchicus]|uniref:dehydrogenase/reductase SDR family member 13 isoform X1 n=1 Tax=Phasianus colchicus TaxID=9054 RepID=UPI00129EF5F2|nr:dehydrogenase/reductase SDR family member 13 isoform X1 [Phasianus colchicus]
MGWWLLGVGLLLCVLLCFTLRSPAPPLALPALHGRTAIVTGGSSGIGEAVARELARCGARVVLATRNALRGEEAAWRIRRDTGNPEVLFMPLDLSSFHSVHAFATAFLQQEPHLHLLINNAGEQQSTASPPKPSTPNPAPTPRTAHTGVSAGGTTQDGFSLPFQVNHLGHFLLTQLLLHRLQSSAPSRVVIVASSAHCAGRLRMAELGHPPPGPFAAFQDYCDSKLANVLHARQLAARLQGTGVTAYAVHPGFVNTQLFRHAPLWLQLLWTPLSRFCFRSAAEGARPVLFCATQDGLEPFSGCYFADCRPLQPWAQGRDDAAARELWDRSQRLLGLRPSLCTPAE